MDKSPRILVLGANGHVGRLLRAAPIPEFSKNAVWHSRSGAGADWGWDILKESPNDVAFDAILHLVRGGEISQEIEIARRVCDLARGRPVIFASSQAVYGMQEGPVTERHPVRPISPYGEAKAATEEVISAYSKGLSLRIGNVAGGDMLFKAMANGSVFLDQFEDGTGPRRSYIGPSTFATTITTLCAKMVCDQISSTMLNFANPRTIAMSDCLDLAGADWKWRSAPVDTLRCLELDTTILQDIVKLKSTTAADLIREASQSGWRLYNDTV